MLQIINQPQTLPIPIGDVKRHLGVTADDRDLDIEALVWAAVAYLQQRTGLTFATTGYRLVIADEEWPSGCTGAIDLPGPPVQSVDSFTYRDDLGFVRTLTTFQFRGNEYEATLSPAAGQGWPSVQAGRVDAVTIDYTAGADEAPPLACHAIKLLVRHWYDNASAVGSVGREIDYTVGSLVRSLGRGYVAGLSSHT